MTDFAASPALTPLFVNTWSRFGASWDIRALHGVDTPVAVTWPSANLGIFVPIWLPFRYVPLRAFWVNGSTAGGNWDIGVFSADLTKLWNSGSTAGSGASQPQYVTISPSLVLDPGMYYLGLSHDVTTANHGFGSSSVAAAYLRMSGVLQAASQVPLASAPTGVTTTAIITPLMGLTRTASGF